MKQSLEKNMKTFRVRTSNISKQKIIKNSIIEILYVWFKKSEASGIYVNGPLLKEEAMNIKLSLNLPVLDGFKALA